MRIMLTVIGGQGDRDVVIDGDDGATVTELSAALGDQAPLATVVRLPKNRAPYGMAQGGAYVPQPRRPERSDMGPPALWR
ncbi:hypothetical protein AB0J43_55935, partial [Nonomuraea fuscirosea]